LPTALAVGTISKKIEALADLAKADQFSDPSPLAEARGNSLKLVAIH
jgi:hypothetical protein